MNKTTLVAFQAVLIPLTAQSVGRNQSVCSEFPTLSRMTLKTGAEKKSTKTPGLAMHLYMCKDCNHKFDEVVDFGKGQHFEDKQECPECSSMNSKWVPMARIDRFSEQFPYFDRGLGVMLMSKQHRRDVCKERGLTPVDGDWNIQKEYDKWDVRQEKEIKEYNDYVDRLDNHPAFRQHREALDKEDRR